MIPVDGLIQLGLSFYEVTVAVRHMGYVKTAGRDVRTPVSTENIQAAVDPSRSKIMERIFGGSLSDGDIGVFTTATLYVEDAAAAGAAIGNRMQTFVTYQGGTYRVVEKADWELQTGTYVYRCAKHFSQDGN